MKCHIEKIAEAANAKFGQVISVINVRSDGSGSEYFVVCKRSEPTFPDRPYMTITANIQNGNVEFYWGHYDLYAAHTQVLEQTAKLMQPKK